MQRDGAICEFSSQCDKRPNDPEESRFFDFARLPWVVFLSILKYLKTSELCQFCLVNKLWQKACQDPSLWRYLDLVDYSDISNQDLIRLSSFSNNVVQLRIFQCSVLTDSGICGALKRCPSLLECTITNCRNLSDNVMTTLGECCHFLKKLDITLSLGFSSDGIRKVCEGCPKLEEIVIDQCSYLTDDTLLYLGNHSTMLKCISATNVPKLTDAGLFALLPGCPHLETVRFPFCGLTRESVNHVVQYCTKIVYLDVRGVRLEDVDLRGIVKSLRKLETLNLGLCYDLTDASLVEIAVHCMELKHLFLPNNKITDEGLFHISTHCQGLLHLDVSWCAAITEVGARYVLNGCPKLKYLGLFRCDRVSDLVVNELNLKFPQVFISTLKTEMDKSFAKKEDLL